MPFYLDIINAFFSFLPVYCKRLCKKREKKIEKKQTAAYKTMIFETIIEEKCSKTRFDEKKRKNKLFTNTLHVTK